MYEYMEVQGDMYCTFLHNFIYVSEYPKYPPSPLCGGNVNLYIYLVDEHTPVVFFIHTLYSDK